MRRLQHVIEAQQFDRELLEDVFSVADSFKAQGKTGHTLLAGKLMACLFYEPSTRTRFSFESAMHRLGGSVITTDKADMFSSAVKGETLQDTIRVVSGYADVIVLRHTQDGAAKLASECSDVPIVNAGDGRGQHPSQAILDLYTIRDGVGKLDGIHVAIVGDLKNGRTARSLVYLLGKFKDVRVTLVAPKALAMGQDVLDYAKRHTMDMRETESMADILADVDCLYMTRIQKERMPADEYARVKGAFVLTGAMAKTMKERSVILHPLPRIDEIAADVDEDHRAAYFKQTRNGMYVRMALLKMLLA